MYIINHEYRYVTYIIHDHGELIPCYDESKDAPIYIRHGHTFVRLQSIIMGFMFVTKDDVFYRYHLYRDKKILAKIGHIPLEKLITWPVAYHVDDFAGGDEFFDKLYGICGMNFADIRFAIGGSH